MRFSLVSAFAIALIAQEVVASSWFSKAAYNKWHETELERWLSDHDMPFPTAADRKDLENKVKTNWQAAVESPYLKWDSNRLQKHLESQGHVIEKKTKNNKDALVNQVKASWFDTADATNKAYHDVKDWIFDSWTDSQLKAFADKHSIPVPQPRKRDQTLKAIRENFQTVANKLGESYHYPGDWLYEQWSDSDLKAWADERGIPAPQPSTRDKLIANVRRNSYIASKDAEHALASASASAGSAKESLTDEVLNAWSDSQIKEWADKNGIKVPQGSTRNELLALARKHSAKLTGDNISDSVSKYVGAATSSAGNQFAKATDDATFQGNKALDQISGTFMHYIDEIMIAVGLKNNLASSASKSGATLASSASKSGASAYAQASKSAKSAKGEL